MGFGLSPPPQSRGIGASGDAETSRDFLLWRSAVGGAPRQQFGSCALSLRRPGEGAEEGAEKGQGDRTERLTSSPAGLGRSKGCGPHFARPCRGKGRTEIPGLGPDCAGTPVLGL